MVENIREWIQAHPEDFQESVGLDHTADEDNAVTGGGVLQSVGEKMDDVSGLVGDYGKDMVDGLGASEVTSDLAIRLRLAALFLILVVGLLYEVATGPGM